MPFRHSCISILFSDCFPYIKVYWKCIETVTIMHTNHNLITFYQSGIMVLRYTARAFRIIILLFESSLKLGKKLNIQVTILQCLKSYLVSCIPALKFAVSISNCLLKIKIIIRPYNVHMYLHHMLVEYDMTSLTFHLFLVVLL